MFAMSGERADLESQALIRMYKLELSLAYACWEEAGEKFDGVNPGRVKYRALPVVSLLIFKTMFGLRTSFGDGTEMCLWSHKIKLPLFVYRQNP